MMRRLLVVLSVFLLVLFVGAHDLLAQAPGGGGIAYGGAGWRGPGSYLSVLKIALHLAVFLLWVYTTDWVSRDALELELDYLRWNPIVFGTFLLFFVLTWLIPIFWIGWPLLILAWAVPLTVYVLHRNSRVEDYQKVLTKDHLRYWAAVRLSKIGIKVQAEAQDPNESGVPVVLNARGGGPTERDEGARLLQARQTPGLRTAREIVADGISRRSDAILLDYTQSGVTVKYLVDGVWQDGEPMEREEADPALESFKVLAGMNPQDRQSRQEGKIGIDYFVLKAAIFDRMEKHKKKLREKLSTDLTRQLSREMAKELADATPPGQLPPEVDANQLELRVRAAVEEQIRLKFASSVGPHTPIEKSEVHKLPYTDRVNPLTSLEQIKASASISTAGTQTGERVLIQIEGKKARFPSLDSIGMRSKMQEQLKELLGLEQGLIVISAMQGQGLRTTTDTILRSSDRFTREFYAVEDEGNRYPDIENVHVTTYKGPAGETPLTILPNLFHQDPQVVVIRDLCTAETVGAVLEEISSHGRMFISTVRAVDSVDAIYRILAMKVPPSDLAKGLTAIVNQRLIRKLCEHCKEPYTPPPQTLQQLGIPPGRVQAFYRPHQTAEQEESCPVCGGVGYLGRTGVIEILVIDETVRKALATGAKPDVLRQVARKAGYRGIQEEGIVLVVKGITSLQELARVVKQA